MSKASGKRKRAVKKAADPWELLFSRDGELPAGEDEAEGLLYGEQGRRPMTQEEGRTAFGFWMIASLALCLIVALLAVSCAQRIGTETASEGRNGWIMILIALVASFFYKQTTARIVWGLLGREALAPESAITAEEGGFSGARYLRALRPRSMLRKTVVVLPPEGEEESAAAPRESSCAGPVFTSRSKSASPRSGASPAGATACRR